MSELSKSALKPPAGKPLGTNWPYKYISKLVIPLMNIWIKKDWRDVQNLPAQGPVLVVSNHLSYADALVLAHFLFANEIGRAHV